jgi:DNA modification methylase
MPIKAGCPKDGVVLDPFAGSGTTGVAARQLGRSSILIEVSDEYCKIAKQRMEWGQQTLDGTEWIEE